MLSCYRAPGTAWCSEIRLNRSNILHFALAPWCSQGLGLFLASAGDLPTETGSNPTSGSWGCPLQTPGLAMKTRCFFLFPYSQECASLAVSHRKKPLLCGSSSHPSISRCCCQIHPRAASPAWHWLVSAVTLRRAHSLKSRFPGTAALISKGNRNDSWKISPNQPDSQASEPLTHPSSLSPPLPPAFLPSPTPSQAARRKGTACVTAGGRGSWR